MGELMEEKKKILKNINLSTKSLFQSKPIE